MNPLTRRVVTSAFFGTLAMIAVIFIPAGTLRYWQEWTWIVVFTLSSSAYTAHLLRHDQGLLERRMAAGVSHEKEPAQKRIIALMYVGFIAMVVLPPLDVRYGWSRVPWQVSILGDALTALSFYVFHLVARVNSYAASNIRVEEGQKVVSTGVYAHVRHPMYFGALFLFIGTPIALGSWWGLLVILVFVPVLYLRIANEEAVLVRDLAGYVEYQQKVRYRMIPYIW